MMQFLEKSKTGKQVPGNLDYIFNSKFITQSAQNHVINGGDVARLGIFYTET